MQQTKIKRARPAAKASTAARKKRRSPEEILEKLVGAAREEFKRSGFAGATTATIARNAEVTEAQLFRYFDSKADLFREAVFEPLNKHFSEFNARYPAATSSDENIREHARLYITELQQFLDEHSKLLLSLVFSQLFSSAPQAPNGKIAEGGGARSSAAIGQPARGQPARVQSTRKHGMEQIESLGHYFDSSAAMMSSRLEKNPKVDPKLLVRVSFAAVLGCVMFKDWIFPAGVASNDDIGNAIIDFVLDGINVNIDSGMQAPALKKSVNSRKKPIKK